MKIEVTYLVAGPTPIVTNFDVDNYRVTSGGALELVINGKCDCIFSPAGWLSLFIKEA